LLLHARGGLLPILSRDAESIRKGDRMQPKQVTHDAVSSCLVSLSLSQKGWRVSKKSRVRGLNDVSYPVITYGGTARARESPSPH
jgi:hypothetical protein